MARTVVVRCSLCIIISLLTVIHCFGKTWTNRKGKRLSGTMIKLEDDIVYIKRKRNGKIVRIELSQLEMEDQLYAIDKADELKREAKALEVARRKAARETTVQPEDEDDIAPEPEVELESEEPRETVAKSQRRSHQPEIEPEPEPEDNLDALGSVNDVNKMGKRQLQSEPENHLPADFGPTAKEPSVLALIGLLVGLIMLIVARLWMLVYAFKEGCLWVLVVLFAPMGELIFTITHWENAKKPFFLAIFGAIIALAGVFSSGGVA